jgi:3D-(3,5/4)-trihydroxycyclohexane-1,2-dione acylhydrolase (decyclizing)
MATVADNRPMPSDAQVIGAVQRVLGGEAVVVCAAGGLPAELHKLWRAETPGSYHLAYGYSCMGYEIAGGLGVKMARPQAEVIVMAGDGSYLMLNSEIATSVGMGKKLVIVLLDNGGFGCIHRLQRASGSPAFNNPTRCRTGGFPGACREPWGDRRAGARDCGTGAGAETGQGRLWR